MTTVTCEGIPTTLFGAFIPVGIKAPEFVLIDKDLNEITLASLGAKKKIISIVPSLDTEVCQLSTQKINSFAKAHTDIEVLIVSADLPFAQTRFCHDASLANVRTLSMMRNKEFAEQYGVLIVSGPLAGITARAVVVLDETNKVVYTQLVSEIVDEPDYDALFNAAQQA